MRFQLKERKRNALNVTYHVLDEAQTICGSICVKLEEAGDLLRHWQGPTASTQPKPQSPVSALAAAFMRNRRPVSKANVLRGCMG
jgi:hypothetical protein